MYFGARKYSNNLTPILNVSMLLYNNGNFSIYFCKEELDVIVEYLHRKRAHFIVLSCNCYGH